MSFLIPLMQQKELPAENFFPIFIRKFYSVKHGGYIGEAEGSENKTVYYIKALADDARVEEISALIAHRYGEQAKGVAFGDPDAILSMMATLCRDKYVSLYGPVNHKENKDVEVSPYTEEYTSVMDDIVELTEQTGNRVIVGRQTGDGDIFEWGEKRNLYSDHGS